MRLITTYRQQFVFRVAIAVVILASLLAATPAPVQAQDGVSVEQNEAVIDFPLTILFELSASSGQEISSVVLRYGTNGRSCIATSTAKEIDIDAGKRIDAEWEWDLVKGSGMPNGAQVWWEWDITTADGELTTTERQTRTVIDQALDWQTTERGQFTLYWAEGDDDFADEMLDIAVDSMDRLSQEMGIEMEKDIILTFYPSHETLLGALPLNPEWTGGVAYSTYNALMIEMQPGQLEWARSVIPHEITHLVVNSLIFNCVGVGIPTWLSEGLAQYAEGPGLREDYKEIIKSAYEEDRLLDLKTLAGSFSSEDAAARLAYAQSLSVVTFMYDAYGTEMMAELLLAVQDGQPFEKALNNIYGRSTADMDAAWRYYYANGAVPTLPAVTPTVTATPEAVPTLSLGSNAAPTAAAPKESVPTPVQEPDLIAQVNTKAAAVVYIFLAVCALAVVIVALVVVIMLFKKRKSAWLVVIVVVMALVLLCLLFALAGGFLFAQKVVPAAGSVGSSSDTLRLLGGMPDERDFDPARTTGSATGYVGLLYSGLVRLSPDLVVVPELAEDWQVSEDGTIYTFTLNPDNQFASGEPLTAQDVKDSWERAADPETDSSTAGTYLGDIVGVKERLSGQADEIAGVRVIDDYTLEVELDAPKAYFLTKLSYPTSYVVDVEAMQDLADEWFLEATGSGPYIIKEYDEREYILFERNPLYHTPALISQVHYNINPRGSYFSLYEENQIDFTYIDFDTVVHLKESGSDLADQVRSGPSLTTVYLAIDTAMPPLDDPHVRRALALSLDKDMYLERLGATGLLPAETILPPGMPGFSNQHIDLSYDIETARQELAQSDYADDMPVITITTMGSGGESPVVVALAENWRRELGVEVEVDYLHSEDFVAEVRQKHGQIVFSSWHADYPDPENFLDLLFHSDADFNFAAYQNAEVDVILEEARTEMDASERIHLYQEAEEMLLSDVAVIPLWNSTQHVLVKPRVKGFVLSPLSAPWVPYVWIEE